MEKSRQYEKELFLVIKALEEEGVHFEQDEENSEDDTGYVLNSLPHNPDF